MGELKEVMCQTWYSGTQNESLDCVSSYDIIATKQPKPGGRKGQAELLGFIPRVAVICSENATSPIDKLFLSSLETLADLLLPEL